MACSNSGEAERAFRDALGNTTLWRIIGNRLDLVDAAGTLLARFEASGSDRTRHAGADCPCSLSSRSCTRTLSRRSRPQSPQISLSPS